MSKEVKGTITISINTDGYKDVVAPATLSKTVNMADVGDNLSIRLVTELVSVPVGIELADEKQESDEKWPADEPEIAEEPVEEEPEPVVEEEAPVEEEAEPVEEEVESLPEEPIEEEIPFEEEESFREEDSQPAE